MSIFRPYTQQQIDSEVIKTEELLRKSIFGRPEFLNMEEEDTIYGLYIGNYLVAFDPSYSIHNYARALAGDMKANEYKTWHYYAMMYYEQGYPVRLAALGNKEECNLCTILYLGFDKPNIEKTERAIRKEGKHTTLIYDEILPPAWNNDEIDELCRNYVPKWKPSLSTKAQKKYDKVLNSMYCQPYKKMVSLPIKEDTTMNLTDLQVYYLTNYITQLSDTGNNNVQDILDDLSSILGGTYNQWAYAYNQGAALIQRKAHILEF